MPAKSDKQQTAARIAHAIKKGKVKPKKGTASAQMAKGMSDKQIKHFMVKEEGEGGTTSVNIGTGSSKPRRTRMGGVWDPKAERERALKKRTQADLDKPRRTKMGWKTKEEAAALGRVMQLVYEEEKRLRHSQTS